MMTRIMIRRREVAAMLGVSEKTLSRWHQAGILTAVPIGRRLLGYDPEAVRRFARTGVAAEPERVEGSEEEAAR